MRRLTNPQDYRQQLLGIDLATVMVVAIGIVPALVGAVGMTILVLLVPDLGRPYQAAEGTIRFDLDHHPPETVTDPHTAIVVTAVGTGDETTIETDTADAMATGGDVVPRQLVVTDLHDGHQGVTVLPTEEREVHHHDEHHHPLGEIMTAGHPRQKDVIVPVQDGRHPSHDFISFLIFGDRGQNKHTSKIRQQVEFFFLKFLGLTKMPG